MLFGLTRYLICLLFFFFFSPLIRNISYVHCWKIPDKCLVRIVLLSNVFFPCASLVNDVIQCLDSLKSDRSLWDVNIVCSSMVILNEISSGLPSAWHFTYIVWKEHFYIGHHIVHRPYCKKDCFLKKKKKCSVITRPVKHLRLTILKKQICHGKIDFVLISMN